MTLDEVKAYGATTLGTLSYIPREDWKELALSELRQMERELSDKTQSIKNSRDRKWMISRGRAVSKAITLAENGERIFAVVWNEDAYGKDFLFAATHLHQPKARHRFPWFSSN